MLSSSTSCSTDQTLGVELWRMLLKIFEARKEEPGDEVEGNSIGGDGVVKMSTGQVDGQ